MDDTKRRNTRNLAVFLAIFMGLLLVFFIFFVSRQNSQSLTITNIDSCSKGINKDLLEDLNNSVYGFVKSANDYNKKETLKKYDATMREGSCKTTEDVSTTTNGGSTKLKSTEVIVDIPNAKQSWRVLYNWSASDVQKETVVNGATPKCVSKDELRYGDFNCEKILSEQTYGTDQYDDILQYMPYNGESFNLSYDPNNKTVTAQVLVPSNQANNTELIENNKLGVVDWFTLRNLNPSNYKINYEVVISND